MNEHFNDFRDMLRALKKAQVEFMVVGGYALAAHGIIRGTKDLDLWVRATAQNAMRMWRALAEFGAPLEGLRPDDFFAPRNFLRFSQPPGRVELLTVLSGVSFEDAYAQCIEAEILGVPVPVINREQMIRNKRAAGRRQDLLDADDLEAGRMR